VNSHLIVVTDCVIGGKSVLSVNARDLHTQLAIRKDFSDWIKAQLADLYTQGIDFEVFPLKGENTQRPRIEYALTIECAKHIAMMSRSVKGREIRDYFIECERVAKAKPSVPSVNLSDPSTLRTMLLGYTEKVIELESTVSELAPKVAALNRFATETKGSYSLREAAKSLQMKPRRFTEWLLERRWIYRHPDGGRWLAFQLRLDSGTLEHKVVTGQRNDGTDWGTTQVRVTAKGLARIAELLERDQGGKVA